jgi:hypothetical protein
MYIEWIQLERRKEREKDSSIRIGIGIGVHGMKEMKGNEMDWDCCWN